MLKTIKADYQIILFLGLVAIYHVILQDRGAYAWPDEHLYNDALKSVAALLQFDFPLFCKSLTGFGARPAEATLRLIPAAIQTLLERWQGISPYNPESLRIAASFNIISSFLLSFVFYRLSQLFYNNDKLAAVLATGVYALLVSNNVFIRHIIPYDTALMFCLLSLYLVLKAKVVEEASFEMRRILFAGGLLTIGLVSYPLSFLVTRQLALFGAIFACSCIVSALWIATRKQSRTQVQPWIIAGLVAGFGLAVYPAYYSFPCAVLLVALLRQNRAPYIGLSKSSIYTSALFGLSLLSVVFLWEVVARIGNESYLGCAYRLSKTITQGEFSEGYVFLAKYFVEVEGAIGTLSLVLALIWIATVVVRVLQQNMPSQFEAALALCCTIWIGFYLVYSTQSAVLHKMAFTGRYARMYFPFVVWAAIAALLRISSAPLRNLSYAATAAVLLYTFGSYALVYRNLAYPVNVLHENGIRWEDVVAANKIWESPRIQQDWMITVPAKGITKEARYVTHPEDSRYLLENFGFFNFDEVSSPLKIASPQMKIIYQQQHFQLFSSSLFEGSSAQQRNRARQGRFKVSIYKYSEALG